MKIAGVVPGHNSCDFPLTRGGRVFNLRLTALPLGAPGETEEDLPDPPAPFEFARDQRGAIIRDLDGSAVKTRKTDDPKYQALLWHIRDLREIRKALAGLRNEPSIQIDAKREQFHTALEYYEAVWAEMKAAGITDAEVIEINRMLRELNQGRGARIEAAAEGFLSETQSVSPGKSPSDPVAPSGT